MAQEPQSPQVQTPLTHDQMASGGLRALSDMVSLDVGDPQRVRARQAFAEVHRFAQTEGIYTSANPEVQSMWQGWLRRSETTIRQDVERRHLDGLQPEQRQAQLDAWRGETGQALRMFGSVTPAGAQGRAQERRAVGGMAPVVLEHGDFTSRAPDTSSMLQAFAGRQRMSVTTELTSSPSYLGGERGGTFLVDPAAMHVPVDEHSETARDFKMTLFGPKVRALTGEQARAANARGEKVLVMGEGDDARFMLEDPGGSHVATSQGLVEVPDYSHRSEQFRQWFAGQMPGNAGLFRENLATTYLLNATTEAALQLFGHDAKLQNVPSALGEQPFVMPFTDDPYENLKLMQDPAHMRAVWDLEQQLNEEGKLGDRWWEGALGWGVFGMEFAAFKRGGGGAVGLAAKSVVGQRMAKTSQLIRSAPAAAFALRTAKAGKGGAGMAAAKKAIPLFGFTARSAAEFAVFEAASNAVTGRGTLWDGLVHGGAMGLELAALQTVGAVIPRRLGGWLMKRNRMLGGWLNNVTEAVHRSGESDVLQTAGYKRLEAWLKKMPSENPSLRRALEGSMGSAFAAEWTVRMWDMAVVGALFAGTSHAQQQTGQHWVPLLLADPAKAGRLIMQGMASEAAVGNILGFWLGAFGTTMAGEYAPHRAMRGQAPEQKEAVERSMRDLAWSLAHPSDPAKVAEAAQLFSLLGRLHPEAMEGGVSFAGLTRPPEPPPESGVGGSGPGGRPTPDFTGDVSSSGRHRERVEEMYRGWRAAAPKRSGKSYTWLEDKTDSPRFWVQEGSKYAVAKGRDGLYRVINASGDRAGKKTPRTQEWERLEDAIAQSNRIAQKTGDYPQYRSRRDSGELEFPEAQRQGPSRPRTLEESARSGQRRFFTELREMEIEIEKASPERAAELREELTERMRTAGDTGGRTFRPRRTGQFERELKRQQRIYEENRDEPWAVGKTPVEVVSIVEGQRSAARAQGRRAKILGLTGRGLTSLEQGGPKGSGLAGLTFEQLGKLSPEAVAVRLKEIRRLAAGERSRSRYGEETAETVEDLVRAMGGIRTGREPELMGGGSRWLDGGPELWEQFGGEGNKGKPGQGRLVHPQGETRRGNSWEKVVSALVERDLVKPDISLGELMGLIGTEVPLVELGGTVGRAPAADPAGVEGSFDIDQFRAEAGDGVPFGVRLGQAAEAGLRGRDALEATGVLNPWEPPSSVRSATMLRRLATADEALLQEMRRSGVMEPAELEALIANGVEGALAWQRLAQVTARQMAETRGEGPKVDAYLRAVDELASQGYCTDACKKELGKQGLLDEHGGLHESAPRQMEDILDFAIRSANESPPPGMERMTYLYAGVNPWVALAPKLRGSASSPWNPFRTPTVLGNEFVASRLTSTFARGLEKLGEGRGPRALQAANRIATLAVGRFWSAAGLPSWLKDLHRRLIQDVGSPAAQESAATIYEGQRFVSTLRVGGKRLPRRVRERILKLMDAGYFRDKRIASPEDLEREVGPQYGHLFFDVERELAAADAMGRSMVETGLLQPEQFDRVRGRYVMRKWLQLDRATLWDRIKNQGDFSTFYLPGRDLARAKDPATTGAIRHWDPDVVVTSAHAQEAKMIELMRWISSVANQEGGYSFRKSELETGTDPRWSRGDVRTWMERLAVDPEKIADVDARDPLSGRKYSKASKEMGLYFKNLRDTMQAEADWRAGKMPSPKEHPYTPEKADLIDRVFGEDPLYVDSGTAQELQNIQREAFYVPYSKGFWSSVGTGGDFLGYLGSRMDEGMRFWRKAKTVNNPVHWGLNIFSSVFTNYQTGGVTPWDLVKSVMTGEGRYADSMRRLLWWEKWMQGGRPAEEAKLRELDLWEAHENGLLRQADELVGRLGAGTFHRTLIETGVITNLLGGVLDRGEIKRGLEEAIAEKRTTRDLAFNEPQHVDQSMVEQLVETIVEMSRRNAGGAGRVDRFLVEKLTSSEQQERLNAIATWGATYQLWELMFKYANSLEYLGHNPGMTWSEAQLAGAKGTADYRDTSPQLRRWTTAFDLGISSIGRETGNMEALKAFSQFTFAGPFMLYRSTIRPTQYHSMAAYPLRTAVTGAAWATVAGAITAAGGAAWSSLMEAVPGTPGFQGMALPSKEDLEAYGERFDGVPQPMGGGHQPNMTVDNQKVYGWLWPRIAARIPFVSYAPPRGGRSRLSDVGDFAEPVTTPFEVARTIDNWGQMTGREKGEAIAKGLYGIQPLGMKGALTMFGDLVGGDPGKGWKKRAAKVFLDLGDEFATLMQPTPVSFLSPQWRRMHEMQYADGVPMDEWLSGHLDPFARAQGKGQGLAELAFSSVLPSRKMPAWNSIKSGDDAGLLRTMVAEMLPRFEIDLGPAEQQRALNVARDLRDQITLQVVSTYTHHRRYPGSDFVDLLKPQFDLHVDLRLDDEGNYQLAEQPQTVLGTFIAHQPPEDRQQMLEFAVPFLNSKAFRGRALGAVTAAAALRTIDPQLLHRIWKAALTGPHDVGVLREMELELLDRKEYSNLATWYDVFSRMAPPEGHGGRGAWNRLRKFYENVADGDIALPASAPRLTDPPGRLQDVGTPDVIELMPNRYSMERGGF